MPYTTVIRLPVVVGNPANGFPASFLGEGTNLARGFVTGGLDEKSWS